MTIFDHAFNHAFTTLEVLMQSVLSLYEVINIIIVFFGLILLVGSRKVCRMYQ